jgi:hypothetical protein
MKSLSLSPQDPNFQQIILAELAEIKRRLDVHASTEQSIGKLLQPKEVCQNYGIARNTLEKFFNTGLLTPLRLSPESRKIYVAESQLNQIFKSQINRNR